MLNDESATEALLRRDKTIVIVGLVALTTLAWAYVLAGAGTGMSPTMMTTVEFPPPVPASHTSMPMQSHWNIGYAIVMILMWWIMMIAMMLPSAAPMVLLHARVTRHAQSRGQLPSAPIPSAIFVSGYLSVWAAFSLAATALQWLLERSGLLHQMLMWSTARWLTAALLVVAGLYQLTPLKSACLSHCRAPADYLSRHWHPGPAGAFRMGVVHGAYCLGCCWALMLLLFAGGIMNLLWIAGLALLVLAEKLLPNGRLLSRITAFALIAAGVWIAVR